MLGFVRSGPGYGCVARQPRSDRSPFQQPAADDLRSTTWANQKEPAARSARFDSSIARRLTSADLFPYSTAMSAVARAR